MSIEEQPHTSYVYDAANRITELTDEANEDYTFGYDAANRLTSRVLPNGVESVYNYDAMNRLTRLKHQTSTATLFDNQYAYNPAQQISQIAELAQTRNFSYDDTDRLTNVANPTNSIENFSYDAVGNRTLSHLNDFYTYDPFNRLKDTNTFTYETDANGSRVSKSAYIDPNGFYVNPMESTTYEWDEENRLIGVNKIGFTQVNYEYDALGRRVKSIDGGETDFTYDGLDVVMDKNTRTGVIRTYQNAPGIDNKLKMENSGVSQYFLADHLGSTIGLTDSSGSLTDSTSYDSFGNATNTGFPTRYQFTGREFDNTTGLHYYRARWYDPQIGRFISEDPIGFAGGDVNLYGYVRNQPLIYRDSSGLFPGADILPNTLGQFGGALTAIGGALATAGGAIASSPAVVAGGGFAIGYGIGYYPGQYTANSPSNPFVNGPLNPFGTPFPAEVANLPRIHPLPFPNQAEKCDVKPKPISMATPRPFVPPGEPARFCRKNGELPLGDKKRCFYACKGGGFPGWYNIATDVGINESCPDPSPNDNYWIPGGV